jgi:hypothetical protein
MVDDWKQPNPPEVGQTAKVWRRGQAVDVICMRVNDDGTWLGDYRDPRDGGLCDGRHLFAPLANIVAPWFEYPGNLAVPTPDAAYRAAVARVRGYLELCQMGPAALPDCIARLWMDGQAHELLVADLRAILAPIGDGT